jgi:hypothetical protein
VPQDQPERTATRAELAAETDRIKALNAAAPAHFRYPTAAEAAAQRAGGIIPPMAASDGELCEAAAEHDGRIVTCLAAKGHPAGTVHAAWGSSDTVPVHTWPQASRCAACGATGQQLAADLPFAPGADGVLFCADAAACNRRSFGLVPGAARCDVDWGDATPSQRCTRPAGHDGPHNDHNGNEWVALIETTPAGWLPTADELGELCAKCARASRKPGWSYCTGCLDMCHEASEFDHCCMICAAPEEAAALGYRQPPSGYNAELDPTVDVVHAVRAKVAELIEETSLGTPGARKIRQRGAEGNWHGPLAELPPKWNGRPDPTVEVRDGLSGRDEITPATAAGRNYSCPDCGATASYVAHEERCHRYYVAKFRAALVVDKLRQAVADAETAWTAYSPVSPSAPGWREKREAWIGAAQDASLRAADLLAELDRQAGA